jgi:ketosteroid isomerase-like protein
MTSDRSDEIRAVLERYAAAWASGDLTAIIACYHDEFTLHYFGRNAFSGDHRGKAASLKVLAEFSRRTSRRLLKVESILAGPDLGALLAREMIKHDGAEVEIERVFLYAVQDGLLRECWLYDQDQRLIDEIVGTQ